MFYEDGGTEVDDILKEAGEEIELPQTMKHGSKFEGWYYDYGTYNEKCTLTEMPSKNLVLYASRKKNVPISLI